MLEIAPVELTVPAEHQKLLAVSLPVTFIGPVTLVPVRLVTVSKFEPTVTDSASLTAEPPTVALLVLVRLPAERAPEIVADPQERAAEIVAEAQESALAVAVIAPDVIVRPAARVARAEQPNDPRQDST